MSFLNTSLNTSFSLVIIDEELSFKKIKKDWNILFSKSVNTSPYMSWGFNYNWWINYKRGKRLNILVIKKNEIIIAIFPLFIEKQLVSKKLKLNFSILKNFGFGEACFDYLDVLINDFYQKEIFFFLKRYFSSKKNWDYLSLEGFTSNSLLIKHSNKLGLRSHRTHFYPEIDLKTIDSRYLDFDKGLIKSMSKHNLLFEKYLINDLSINKRLEFLNIFKNLFFQDKKKNFIYGEDNKNYWKFVEEIFINPGMVSISIKFLKYDGYYLSSIIDFIYEGKIFGYQMSYNKNIAKKLKISPGSILLKNSLDYFLKNNYNTFSFLRGEESYKMNYATRKIISYSLCKISRKGRVRILNLISIILVKMRNVKI